jgi:peroxidase
MQGCDGSVLLDSANKTAEKDALPNQTLRGFDFVERVKAAVEKACPDTVSCADVLTLIARDAVWLVRTTQLCKWQYVRDEAKSSMLLVVFLLQSKGPFWEVPLGRRDGSVSISNETDALPPPTANITVLTQLFAAKNLDIKDLVVLSGN